MRRTNRNSRLSRGSCSSLSFVCHLGALLRARARPQLRQIRSSKLPDIPVPSYSHQERPVLPPDRSFSWMKTRDIALDTKIRDTRVSARYLANFLAVCGTYFTRQPGNEIRQISEKATRASRRPARSTLARESSGLERMTADDLQIYANVQKRRVRRKNGKLKTGLCAAENQRRHKKPGLSSPGISLPRSSLAIYSPVFPRVSSLAARKKFRACAREKRRHVVRYSATYSRAYFA